MYYILNQTNQIIAADDKFLSVCGVTHIDELSVKLALGEVKLNSLSEENINIHAGDMDKTYSMSKIYLSSMFGPITLVNLQSLTDLSIEHDVSKPLFSDIDLIHIENDISKENTLLDNEISLEQPLDIDTDLISIKVHDDSEKNISLTQDTSDVGQFTNDISLIDNDLIPLSTEISEVAENNDELFDLMPIKEEKELNFLKEEEEESIPLSSIEDNDTLPILVNISEISQEIGISEEDYNTFLNEYIDTALALEEDLQSDDTLQRSSAIGTLSHLSDVLHLPVIGARIAALETVSKENRKVAVESLYNSLSRLTTYQASQEEPEIALHDTLTPDVTPDIISRATSRVTKNDVSKKGFGTINLDDVKPIHFDFQLEQAANDLSLPVELIEEFVHDFIEQARTETDKMLKAYEEGDLDTIQKIGHLLKGTSSNLRINPLADTLYEIQFCQDSTKLEGFIKNYWGHFLSFENQITVISN